jgi:hypothetical protein
VFLFCRIKNGESLGVTLLESYSTVESKKKVKDGTPFHWERGPSTAYLRYASERRHAVARVHFQRLTQGPERPAPDAALRRLSASRMVGLVCGATASRVHRTTLRCSSKQAIFQYLLCVCAILCVYRFFCAVAQKKR